MTTIVVTTTADTEADDGFVSLREAIKQANATAGADTITFDSKIFTGGANSVIRLGSTLSITDALVIDGSGATGLVITGDASNNDARLAGTEFTDLTAATSAQLSDNVQIFNITGATVSLNDLSLTGGRATKSDQFAGAVASDSTLTLTNVALTGNSSGGSSNFATAVFGKDLTLENVTLAGNAGASLGISAYGLSSLNVLNSTVTGNLGANGGAGVGGASISIANSIILGNGIDVYQASGTPSFQGRNIIGFSITPISSSAVISANASDVFASTATGKAGGLDVSWGLVSVAGGMPFVPLRTDARNPAIDASSTAAPPRSAWPQMDRHRYDVGSRSPPRH